MLSQRISDYIETGLRRWLTALGYDAPDVHIQVETPARLEHGDYSTNIAMQLAKMLKQPPLKIAQEIKAELERSGGDPLVRKMEAVAPGFLNVYVDWNHWASGKPESKAVPVRKVVVEHTSINPNKSAHIGHLRNSCIGDTLVRMLRRSGAQVEVHNYIDDLGNQLADTVVGLLHTPVTGDYSRFGDFCWDVYSKLHKQFETRPELLEERTNVLHALEEGDGNLAWTGTITAERIVREHLEEMKQFGIHYDLLVWESSIVREGFWNSAFELLKQTPYFHKEAEGKLAGCWVLKQTERSGDGEKNPVQETDPVLPLTNTSAEEAGDSAHSKDKVLVRSNGILTYTAKDIAYHLWKFGLLDNDFCYSLFQDGVWSTVRKGASRQFGRADSVINVIDHRQEYPQAMVKQALELLGYREQAKGLRHVAYGVVSLSRSAAAELGIDTSDGKASYAMSGRQGIGMKVSTLLDKMEQVIEDSRSDHTGLSSRMIAAASIRFYLLRYNLQTEVVFDLQQATEISGNTGVYLLYTYSRSLSVLNKGGATPEALPAVPEKLPAFEQPEYALIRQIAAWPDVLDKACRELTPNLICSYAYELCALFNNFYAACPIIKAADDLRSFRLWLVSEFNAALKDVLETLGLPAPSRM
ncbi:arginine--tRNA ligase [Paenibacillus caui]|uniref:arginine--tRNA ligase n=1 Tax=Paenibacillus caui TaxID=2873927 RepID=UPI001CA8EBC0|nr:arginine--tRNA ligase [Paenibacillus caui]